MHAIGERAHLHRLRWADLDGDGHKELVVAPIMGRNAKAPLWEVGVKLAFYRVPHPADDEPWKPIVIDRPADRAPRPVHRGLGPRWSGRHPDGQL